MAQESNEWLGRVERAQKRAEDAWLHDAREAVAIYHAEKGGVVQDREAFNILFSNTETLAPALFNSTPRPDVSARRKKAQPLEKLAAKAMQAYLEYVVDCHDFRYEDFNSAITQAVISSLVPGIGQVRMREPSAQGGHLSIESVRYDRFLHGWAARWQDVPWVAFGHDLTFSDFRARFPEVGKDFTDKDEADYLAAATEQTKDKAAHFPGVLVWEIWDKTSKKVYFVANVRTKGPLKETDWPIQLSSGFPCPKPLTFIEKVGTLTPTSLYAYYKEQAEELNDITLRLRKIIKAIRVRGIYNARIAELSQLLDQEDDNAMIPAMAVEGIAQDGKIDQHIWFLPIDVLVKVANELYKARESVKLVIYEILGIADILRGTSVASETATAQTIKDRWGVLRLKRSQRSVQLFIRDIFRLLVEASAQMVPAEAWEEATGLELLMGPEKLRLTQEKASMEAIGQPPPPELLQMLERPSWDEVLNILRQPLGRSYRIDVETNSTVDIEATEDKQAIAEFMNAMGQFLAGVTPLIQSGTMPFDAAKGMLLEIMRRFRFSKQVEEYIEQMQAPQMQDPKQLQDKEKQIQTDLAELEKLQDLIKEGLREIDGEKKDLEFSKQMFQKEVAYEKQLISMEQKGAEMKINNKLQGAAAKLQSVGDKLVASAQTAAKSQGAAEQAPAQPAVPTELISTVQQLQQDQATLTQAVMDLTRLMASQMEEEREFEMVGADGRTRKATVRRKAPSTLN